MVKNGIVKSLSALLKGITSNHRGDFYCLNCFHSYNIKEKPKNMKNYVMIVIIVLYCFVLNVF